MDYESDSIYSYFSSIQLLELGCFSGSEADQVMDLPREELFMKQLPKSLRKNNCNYSLVIRDGEYCVYQQEVAGEVQAFEIFKIQTKPQSVFKNRLIPKREIFPCNESFGKTAWSCRTLVDALKRLNELKK